MIEAAARAAVARASRLRPVVGHTRDEALQDARIGAWRAMRAPCVDDDHRRALMALAGYHDILDARAARYRQSGGGDHEHELTEAHHGAASDAAPELIAVAQALAAIERLREPLPAVAAMLIQGHEAGEIAAHFHVSASRVSQWRRALQLAVSPLLIGA